MQTELGRWRQDTAQQAQGGQLQPRTQWTSLGCCGWPEKVRGAVRSPRDGLISAVQAVSQQHSKNYTAVRDKTDVSKIGKTIVNNKKEAQYAH